MFVFKLAESIVMDSGEEYSADDIISWATLDKIMAEFYEVSGTIIKVK